ncbi:MAG: RsmD family RNA methyltransferase, partial [Polyangiales bacterium]
MRVVGGSLRSRTLRAPKGSATRPTTDRVRESLFAVLGDVSGLEVLDLYAGTGALAIEALSRGAAAAVLVERDRAALDAIRVNVQVLPELPV